MKIKLSVIALASVIIILAACSKDLYTTSPTLKFESVDGNVFPQPSQVVFKLQCTDKEGDVVDTIWVARISKVAACGYLSDTVGYAIPNFQPPKNVKAEFDFTYTYPAGVGSGPTLSACSTGNSQSTTDTSYFRFWMKDKAQHTSDTVQSPDLVFLKQ